MVRTTLIRPATARDAAALSELAKRTWAESFGWSIDAEQAQAELEKNRSQAYFLDATACTSTHRTSARGPAAA